MSAKASLRANHGFGSRIRGAACSEARKLTMSAVRKMGVHTSLLSFLLTLTVDVPCLTCSVRNLCHPTPILTLVDAPLATQLLSPLLSISWCRVGVSEELR